MDTPFFSVVITSFNRARIVRRCIDSCLAQSFEDFEIVVVDDASTDDTAASLAEVDDPRLRVVTHDENRGINPARRSGADAARGEWVVVIDSDDELLPEALARLRELAENRPPEVRAIRFRQRHDDGHITPSYVPDRPYDYEGRIRWAEAEGGEDAGRCLHRSVYEVAPYIADRRGAIETLYELNLAEAITQICVDEVLSLLHHDAPNSWLRNSNPKELLPRLKAEAPDLLWMAETALERHGAALRRWGPNQYVTLLRIASTQSFLLGRRRQGLRWARRALRLRPIDPLGWVTTVLGLLGPTAVSRGIQVHRSRRK